MLQVARCEFLRHYFDLMFNIVLNQNSHHIYHENNATLSGFGAQHSV